ncbi:hypothetical protein C0J52_00464 [Blattella germanica]|nr:hypothetical protein C0J52_00464 [Blattella germanica]
MKSQNFISKLNVAQEYANQKESLSFIFQKYTFIGQNAFFSFQNLNILISMKRTAKEIVSICTNLPRVKLKLGNMPWLALEIHKYIAVFKDLQPLMEHTPEEVSNTYF